MLFLWSYFFLDRCHHIFFFFSEITCLCLWFWDSLLIHSSFQVYRQELIDLHCANWELKYNECSKKSPVTVASHTSNDIIFNEFLFFVMWDSYRRLRDYWDPPALDWKCGGMFMFDFCETIRRFRFVSIDGSRKCCYYIIVNAKNGETLLLFNLILTTF